MEKRLFIVANRLPLTIDAEKGIRPASGGLVSAIDSYLKKPGDQEFSETFWAGVPGCLPVTWSDAAQQMPPVNFTFLPVFVPEKEYDGYYNGYANSLIWPLFHYFPSYAEYHATSYEQYQIVNELFAETLCRHLRPGDTVWIHDYHLMGLAALLRKALPELTIGFFLHIPFPSFEIFRLLPRKWQQEMLQGLLGADLIGFHTIDYAGHFLQTVQMVLGLDNDHHIIHYQNRLVKVDVFPISINFRKFHDAYDDQKVSLMRAALQNRLQDRKIIFSVDRLDYTKGVHNRLKAYECFLKANPQYHEKVVFIMVIVPSRDTIGRYAERKRMIDETISNINSMMGNLHWQPVIYQYNCLQFEEMIALYSACHLALITPLRDGMNLVAKEFVASRKDGKGVLVISEMAGAARELTDALIINPNDVLEMAQKIREALEMSLLEQGRRLQNMQRRIRNYDVQAWAEDFMTELKNIRQRQESFQIQFLDEYARIHLYQAYEKSTKRLILLDYDGTLVPFSSEPETAVPGKNLLDTIARLCAQEQNEVYLISGRNSAWLDKYFHALPLNLVAEHGARYKRKGREWETDVQTHNEWKEQVHNIMEMYVRRCAHSFIEEKDFSMVWHFRNAHSDHGKLRSAELMSELNEVIRSRHLQVIAGNKIVEVRQSGTNKGLFLKKLIEDEPYDFIFAVGDDRTDEDMFRVLAKKENSYTIKVGPEASYAIYNLHSPHMVVSLLEGMNHMPVPAVLH